MNNCDLSVVIVNYKSWEVLKKCLDSFTEHPPKLSYEIIVVDNDSQDGQFDKFDNKFPEIKLIANSGNYGFSSGCNLGAEIASGEYLLFLNPDTMLNTDNSIKSMFDFLHENKNVGIVSCRTLMPNRIGGEISYLSPWMLLSTIRSIYKFFNKSKISARFKEEDSIWYPDMVGGSVMTIKKSFFEKIGGMNDNRYWMYYEDTDLCRRVRENGKNVAIIRNKTINHIGGGASKTNQKNVLMLKVEMIISAHNYIYESTSGIERIILITLYCIKSLVTSLVKTTLTLPLFWSKRFRTNFYLLTHTIMYYLYALTHLSYKSIRIKKQRY